MKRRMLLANVGFRAKLYGYYPFSNLNGYTINPADLISLHTQFVDGKIGKCIEFLNTGAAFARTSSVSNKYSFTDGTKDIPFSLSFWIYYKGGGTGDRIIFGRNAIGSSAQQTNSEYVMVITVSGILAFRKFSLGNFSNSIVIRATSTISTNQWYHIAYTDDGSGIENIYINGELQETEKVSIGSGFVRMSTTLEAREGFGNALGTPNTINRILGMIDDFGIFKNYILTQRDIDYIYNGGVGRSLK